MTGSGERIQGVHTRYLACCRLPPPVFSNSHTSAMRPLGPWQNAAVTSAGSYSSFSETSFKKVYGPHKQCHLAKQAAGCMAVITSAYCYAHNLSKAQRLHPRWLHQSVTAPAQATDTWSMKKFLK